MRASLARWIGEADALRHLEHFRIDPSTLKLEHIRTRAVDFYTSLVGELFERMRHADQPGEEWARLGNALAQFSVDDEQSLFPSSGISKSEALLFAASAFYFGGYPASALLTVRSRPWEKQESDISNACFDLLERRHTMRSVLGAELLRGLRQGNMLLLRDIGASAAADAVNAMTMGPNEWIPARLLTELLGRFLETNVRAVLPDGEDNFWTPLVSSLLERSAWEFFPSQIEAIQRGLLESSSTFSLQMPTGAGKTALSETLLYWHTMSAEGTAAVLLVPYRSLASELRESLVRRLNSMGISARCAYGGTVPIGDEVRDLDDARVMVATPEALSAVLSAEPDFFRRITLVICDEGHLLDSRGRGVSLELLLARMRAREDGAPRLVFVSAIVPNIEEINAWLGGTTETVVRSEYRPALAEFAVLRETGSGASYAVAMDMHPQEDSSTRFTVDGFLRRESFQWTNEATGRRNTYGFRTVKTRAIAAARKALGMGTAAVFTPNKRGNQGAVGLAEELLHQLTYGLTLPEPAAFTQEESQLRALQYLADEYGPEWIGTRALQVGAVLHHGDIPQETREVIERLLRRGDVRFAICTNTLAEGVNLPIRTLVLYSVQRRRPGGQGEDLLARDIKNLVGRAGRAGATTTGLVICANAAQWPIVEPVAKGDPGEPVRGALRRLVERLQRALAAQNVELTNPALESTLALHTLVDGVDATLIDLATEEIGEEELVQMAIEIADETFASRQATQESSKDLLRSVFELRARRVVGIRAAGRLGWVRETGTRARMLDTVANDLFPATTWEEITNPIDDKLIAVMLEWAWTQTELRSSIREAYRIDDDGSIDGVRQSFFDLISSWLSGSPFVEIANRANLTMDDLLGIHNHAVTFVLQSLVEQAVALLERLLQAQNRLITTAVSEFPEHLRFGVPTDTGRMLAARGVRHRRAAVELGKALAGQALTDDRDVLFPIVRQVLLDDSEPWRARLGSLVFDSTLRDLEIVS